MTITREMIMGARITEVHETYRTSDDLDFCYYYFTCDRGFTFSLPCGGGPWKSEQIPAEAKRMTEHWLASGLAGRLIKWLRGQPYDDFLQRLRQTTIAGVLCEPLDVELGFYEPGDTVMVMNDGSTLSSTPCAPHGTGAAGLYYRKKVESASPISRMTDYFSIPVE